MADHEHGSMDIREQEKSFDGFIKLVKFGAIATILILIFITLVNG